MKVRVGTVLGLLALAGVLPSGARAASLGPDNGLDAGQACLESSFFCTGSFVDFDLAAAQYPATGSIVFSAVDAVDLTLSLPTATMTGSFDGVTSVVFTDIVLTVTDWKVVVSATDITDDAIYAPATGTITGDYQQYAGATPVGSLTPLDQDVEFRNLLCSPPSLAAGGQCGFQIGLAKDFTITLGDGSPALHQVQWTFNVVTPEPGTGLLVGLGLVVLSQRARRRH